MPQPSGRIEWKGKEKGAGGVPDAHLAAEMAGTAARPRLSSNGGADRRTEIMRLDRGSETHRHRARTRPDLVRCGTSLG
jgi:hypothetical protein